MEGNLKELPLLGDLKRGQPVPWCSIITKHTACRGGSWTRRKVLSHLQSRRKRLYKKIQKLLVLLKLFVEAH